MSNAADQRAGRRVQTPPMTAEQMAAWRDAPVILAALKLSALRSQLDAQQVRRDR